jgi:hypothetical protein
MNRKNILAIVGAVIIALAMIATVTVFASGATDLSADSEIATFSEANIPSETTSTTEPEEEVVVLEPVEVERVEPTTYDEANTLLDSASARHTTAKAVYDGLISLGYAEEHPAVVLAKTDIEIAQGEIQYYKEKLAEFEIARKWEERAAEYPAATEAWLYMKNEFGWSDTVCAGIIGNLMAECGGCWTQDLDWDINTKHGMGMVQWIGGRRSALVSRYGSNPSIKDQLNFVRDELYGTNGVRKQVTSSQLDKIMNASSPEECAFAFATYYERCAEQHRAPRRGYARTAYNYFVD